MLTNLLAAAEVFKTIGSVLLAILILLAMITVHEFGHYVAGKILGFRIDEFSIGFGPAIFKRKNKKSGELFALRIIPLGGFCAFHGEDGLEEEKKPEEKPEEPFPEIESQAAEAHAPQSPTEEYVEVSAISAQTENDAPMSAVTGENAAEEIVPKGGSFTEMKPWKRIIVLVAGALMNYLLALVLIIVSMFAYGQTMLAVYEMEDPAGVSAEYIEYGLRDLDVFLKADGKSLYLTTDIARVLNGKKQGDMVELYISRVVGYEGEGEDRVSIREEMTVNIMLRADVEVKNSADLDGVWKALGIRYIEEGEDSGYSLASKLYRFGFFETLGRSFVYSFKIAGSIFRIIGELLTGHLGITAVGGPVTTITMTSQIASRSFRSFLEIASFIGVNLAVFNLLPIPALDGSKVVFTIIEWIRGKPISRKVEAIIHAVGFVLIIGFAILVDILQFVI